MYYHVCIERIDPDGKNISDAEYDFTDREVIKNKYVSPYIGRKSFYFDGSYILCEKIKKMVIIQTDVDSTCIDKVSKEQEWNQPLGYISALATKSETVFKWVTKGIEKKIYLMN